MAKLQCTKCGGRLILNADGNSSECENCGLVYTDETMKKMMVEISGGKVEVEGISTIDKLLDDGYALMKLGEWEKSVSTFMSISDSYPREYRAWWGLTLAYTRELTGWFTNLSDKACQYACSVAPEGKANELEKEYSNAFAEHMQRISLVIKNVLPPSHGENTNLIIWNCEECISHENGSVTKYNRNEIVLRFFNNSHDNIYMQGVDGYYCSTVEEDIRYAVQVSKDDYVTLDVVLVIDYVSPDRRSLQISRLSLLYQHIRARDVAIKLIDEETTKSDKQLRSFDVYKYKINEQYKEPGSCYIATAVYGSYDAPEVLTLRRFRDDVLSTSILGRAFISTYYHLSPNLAKKLKKAKRTSSFIRKVLDKWVVSIENTEQKRCGIATHSKKKM